MTTSFPPISYPSKPVPPFTAEPPRNQFPGFFPDMWKNITGKPYITVSSKGLANGLSEYFNDGADFGPDSLQADGSLTQTSGWKEALAYLEPTGGKITYVGNDITIINVPLTYNSSKPLIIEAVRGANNSNTVIGPGIQPSSSFPSGSFLLNVTTPVGNTGSLTIRDFAFYGNVGTGTTQVAGGIQGNPNGSTTFAVPQVTFDNCKFVYLTDAVYANQEGSGPINIINSVFTYCNHGIHLTGSSGGTNHYTNIEFYLTNIPIYIVDGATPIVNISNFVIEGALAFAYIGEGDVAFSNGVGQLNNSTDALYGFGSGSGTPGVSLSNCSFSILSAPAGTAMFYFVPDAPNGAHWNITSTGTTYTFVGNSGTAYPLYNYTGANVPAFDVIETGGNIVLQQSASITIGYTAYGAFWIKKYNYVYISSVSTPSVPASGTAQQNTYSYPMDVYIYGGDVTEIQITKNGTAYTVLSVSTAIAMSGQSYKLNPGDSITVTYSTAPSWEWLSD